MSVPTQQSNPPLKQANLPKGAKGFTLLELLVIVAVIGVLAAIAIPAYYSYIDKARITVAIGTLDAIRKDFESFHIDYQEYPTKPIDSNGIDGAGRTAFSNMLLNQINQDLTNVNYNSATNNRTYTLTAKARDKDQTILTLTPTETSKAP